VQWPLGVKIAQFRQTMDDAGWDPGRQICAVFRGKGDWAAKRPGGKICAVLEVSELRLREDTGDTFAQF